MAVLKSIASGNFTDAATWGVIHVNGAGGTSSFLDARNSNQSVNTTTTASSSFQVGSNLNCIGVAIQIAWRNITLTTPTTTLSVELWNATTSSQVGIVTIQVADLPNTSVYANTAEIGWVFFKFGTAKALTTGTNYQIRLFGSHNGMTFVYRDLTSGNWSRAIVTDTTAAPGASDTLIITGEHTAASAYTNFNITMNVTTGTTTVYGLTYVDNRSSLTYGTASTTNYRLMLNANLFVRGYGKFEIGNSGSTFPSTSTAELQFQPTVQAGAGLRNVCGDIYLYGDPKTYYRAKLGATANAGVTSLTTDVSTGWKNGDIIAIASTSRTPTEREHRTMNADAVGTTVTVSAGLSAQHLANLENLISADVGNLRRNVRIRSNSTTNTAIVSIAGSQSELYANAVEFENVGSTTFSNGGILLGVSLTDCKVDISNCAIYNLTTQTSIGVWINDQSIATPKPVINFKNNTFYGFQQGNGGFTMGNTISSTVDTIVITDNLFINTNFIARSFNLLCTGNTFNSCGSAPLTLNSQQQGNLTITHRNGGFDNTTIYSSNGDGFNFGNLIPSNLSDVYVRNLIIGRCGNSGISNGHHATRYPVSVTGVTNYIFKDFKIFGCATAGINITSTINGGLIFEDGYVWRGTSTLPMATGLDLAPFMSYNVLLNNVRFGITPSNTLDALSTQNIRMAFGSAYGGKIIAANCIFSGGTEFGGTGGVNFGFEGGYLASLNHNQISGNNKIFGYCGIMQTDTSIFNTSSPSIRLIPNNASFKLISNEFRIPVNAGGSANISIYIRKSSAGDGSNYNGAQPRIICRRNYAAGTNFYTDTVVATASAANGTWEQVQGTTPTVTNDCVLSFYVDCHGTVGWINIDDISSSTTNDTRGTKYWGEFHPYIEADYQTGSPGSGGEKSFTFFS